MNKHFHALAVNLRTGAIVKLWSNVVMNGDNALGHTYTDDDGKKYKRRSNDPQVFQDVDSDNETLIAVRLPRLDVMMEQQTLPDGYTYCERVVGEAIARVGNEQSAEVELKKSYNDYLALRAIHACKDWRLAACYKNYSLPFIAMVAPKQANPADKIHFTSKGNCLLFTGDPGQTVVTLENTCKWNYIYIVHPDGSVTEHSPAEITDTEGVDDDGEYILPSAAWVDHLIHPRVLWAFALKYKAIVDERAAEVATARWLLETGYFDELCKTNKFFDPNINL